MITAIEIENFKAIGERVRIELKPITLLFGPNSSGKSTIIQAIHYMREILERGNVDADYTSVGGETIDLGGFRQLVHGHDLARAVSLRLDVSLEGCQLPGYLDDEIDSCRIGGKYLDEHERELDETLSTAMNVWFEVKAAWDFAKQRPTLTAYESGVDGELMGTITLEQGERRAVVSCRPNWMNSTLRRWKAGREGMDGTPEGIEAAVQERMPAMLEALSGTIGVDPTLEQIAAIRRYLASEVAEFPITTRFIDTNKYLASEDSISHGGDVLLSEGYSSLPALGSRLVLRDDVSTYSDRLVCEALLSRVLMGPGELARDALRDAFRYLGPLRRVPPRYHEPARSFAESRWATGLGAWDVIAGNKEVAVAANSWLSAPDRLDTGYSVELKEFKEVELESDLGCKLRGKRLKAGSLARTFDELPVKTRLAIRETNRGLEVGPHDIGVGLSQLIPVVVAAVDRSKSLVAMEQPELHIHPAWQTRLGDLIIAEATQGKRTFLLETHSEHLLLRLLRRIRETSEEGREDLRLLPENIAVMYVEKVGDTARVHHLRVDQSGEFLDKWPHGFFDERAEELF